MIDPKKLAAVKTGRSPEQATMPPQQLKPETLEWYREFLSFDTHGDTVLEDMLTRTAAFINAFTHHDNRKRYWLTLAGTCGVGKTHLAKAVAKTHQNVAKSPGKFVRWIDALNYMRDGHHNYASELARESLLVIDDIGAEHGSEYGSQKLLEVLDKRLGKWTFITSNLTMERFAEIDRRIASRLVRDNNQVLECVTTDYALRN